MNDPADTSAGGPANSPANSPENSPANGRPNGGGPRGVQDLIDLARDRGGLAPDDAVEALLPLFREVAALHAEGLVAPLRGTDALVADEQYRLHLDGRPGTSPQEVAAHVAAVQQETPPAVEVTRRSGVQFAASTGVSDRAGRDVALPGEPLTRPVLVGGWQTWEHLLGHHDALCDVAVLGQLLVALACGLDLADAHDVDLLATHRRNLFRLNPRLHPVIALIAGDMIEPDRRRRAQDVAWLAERLEDYRDQPLDFDLAEVTAGIQARTDRRRAVLAALRDRLFDLSRRNRLLYFRPTQQSFDLTEASVPLLLDVRNIRPEHLCTWQPQVAGRLLSGSGLPLGSVVRWEDAPYAAGLLDGLIAQARRDAGEYGTAQLRLVVAFLRWHDLKNEPERRIASPLLLLPVDLTRRRGVRDSYVLRAESPVAEVNPALRQHLRQLYGLELPEAVDVTGDGIEALHAELVAAITATEPAVRLTLQQRPRIELVRARALLRVDAYRRRTGRSEGPGTGRGVFGGRVYAYSYRRPDYAPLGVQLFRDRVAYHPPALGVVLGGAPDPSSRYAVPSVTGTGPGPDPGGAHEAQTYTLDREGEANPYAWDLDLCALTLTNVNYRTMSLVRDYNDLIDDASAGQESLLDQVFSDLPRPLQDRDRPGVPLPDRYLVVPGDASQVAAIAKARSGDSFVIQGPPGTGKSQTITNLIADYVARGKRVLFVSQKRAAIDVVHSRLRRHGLDELACLIHDSQADKKAFVRGLQATYEGWLATGDDLTATTARRSELVAGIGRELDRISGYEAALATATPASGPSPRALLERLVDLHEARWDGASLPRVRRILPTASAWWTARDAVAAVGDALRRAGAHAVLATHPARLVCPAVLAAVRPDAEAATRAEDAAVRLRAAVAVLDRLARAMPGELPAAPAGMTLATATALTDLGVLVLPLAHHRRLPAVRFTSELAEQLDADAQAVRDARAALERATSAAAGWHTPLRPEDARAALEVARAKEPSWTRAFSSAWRRVRRAVAEGYRADGPVAVPPSVTRALELLVAAQSAQAQLAELARAGQERWGLADPNVLVDALAETARREDPWTAAALTALGRVESPPGAASPAALAELLAAAREPLRQAVEALGSVVTDVDDLPLADLLAALDALASPTLAPVLRALAPALATLDAHPEVAAALRRLPAEPEQVEYAVAAAALDEVRAQVPALGGFDGDDLTEAVGRVQELLPSLYAGNAAVVVARARSQFLGRVAHSTRSVTGMSPDERALKATWSAGRRELEHEFGKVMRFKSIRELASDESGAVVAALRPVWLMSPTSVSDTLPLQPSLFDVVIYDEASQIPIEEAVPAMYRGGQVVVVGDQMQLPPTSYFTTRAVADGPAGRNGRAAEPDEDAPDDEDEIGVVLDGDSFLAQSAVRLPSTMLTWHYRSRYEALIRFSNAAFYDARLSTVPDRAVIRRDRPDLVIDVSAVEHPPAPAPGNRSGSGTGNRSGSGTGPGMGHTGDGPRPVADLVPPDQVSAAVDALLSRSISLHRTRGAVYRRRTNPGEAAYLAALVRELLRRDTGLTLGIVAFSQAQQSAIEHALEELADADPDFARRYEAELTREDDNQFVGLFVKNLENVQGDERDVILISVCYAPGANGRMVMNFGPINQQGGERRLNVIFSRARRHMGVVSTIDATRITNTYNDGAATLRGFLAYAEAVSRGDDAGAETLLTALRGDPARSLGGGTGGTGIVVGVGRSLHEAGDAAGSGPVARRLADALRRSGVEVAEQVGHSAFRCDLALRRPGETEHRVAVLVDTTARTAAETVDERVLSHPAVLRAAGWQIAHVLTKDWYDDPHAVTEELVNLVGR
jgi:hypothetical protein